MFVECPEAYACSDAKLRRVGCWSHCEIAAHGRLLNDHEQEFIPGDFGDRGLS